MIETIVAPGGRVTASLSVTPEASEGPALVTVTVCVRLLAPLPAVTGSGASLLVTCRSTRGCTVTLSSAAQLLLTSLLSATTPPVSTVQFVAVLLNTPAAAELEVTFTSKVLPLWIVAPALAKQFS